MITFNLFITTSLNIRHKNGQMFRELLAAAKWKLSKSRDYYSVLGVTKSASQSQVRQETSLAIFFAQEKRTRSDSTYYTFKVLLRQSNSLSEKNSLYKQEPKGSRRENQDVQNISEFSSS